jgi:hypothetical protein
MTLLIIVLGYLLLGATLSAAIRIAAGPAVDALEYLFLICFWPFIVGGLLFEVAREIRADRVRQEAADAVFLDRLGR